jgi:serine/threonine protein kinase
MGTIDFLSPEQAADGRMADHRSDLYSLGCTLLFLLTGKVPYSGDQFCSMPARIHGHLFLEPPALSNGSLRVSSRMQLVLARLLQKRPEDRFQSANEVVEFLNTDNSLVGASNPERVPERFASKREGEAFPEISVFHCGSLCTVVVIRCWHFAAIWNAENRSDCFSSFAEGALT